MSKMQGKKGTVAKRSRAWSDANKQGPKARMYLDNIPKGLKLKYGASPQNRVLAVRKSVYPIPDVLVTKLRTSWTQAIATGAAGVFGSGSYYGNSMADPSNAVGAFQPRFFDQLMAIYRAYTVYGVKLRIKLLRSDTAAVPMRVFFVPSSASSVPIADAYSDGNELPGTMVFDTALVANATGDVNGANIQSRYYDVGKFFGRDQESIMDDSNFSASNSGNNPATLFYIYYGAQALTGSTQGTCYVEVQMTQYVALRGVFIPTTST